MKRYTGRGELRQEVMKLRQEGLRVGFVPTMGALHAGHLSLIRCATAENDRVVVSIFINPTQFNNKEDLEHYPRTPEADFKLLEEAGVHYVFHPEAREMYPEGEQSEPFDFQGLDQVMEGINRPGHFDGVATIVYKLLNAVPAHRAYFGKKDYQQLLIIRSMVAQKKLGVEIVACKTVREADGLAMSSRNMRLNEEERRQAPAIYQTLKEAVSKRREMSVDELKTFVVERINRHSTLHTEYFEVACGHSLKIINDLSESDKPMGFIVVYAGKVRLIDHIDLYD